MNNKKGITLISLVVTIIVLLILSMVAINAVVGDNGILKNAQEGKLLATLSDIIFDLESDIIDINMNNMGKKLISTEMIDELEKKGSIAKGDTLAISQELYQYDVIDNRLKNLKLGINGDLWLDNYKRGKIQLSNEINTIYSDNKKMAVIDGTVSEYDSSLYELHALERNDFAFWVNKYGEIISQYPDTLISVNIPRDEEYTAVYNKNLKYDLLNTLSTDSTSEVVIGLESTIVNDNYGNYEFEVQSTHCYNSHWYNDFSEFEDNNKYVFHQGIMADSLGIVISDKYENLVLDEDGKIMENGTESIEISEAEGLETLQYEINDPYEIFDFYDFKADLDEGVLPIDSWGESLINNYNNLKYTSVIDNVHNNINEKINEYKEKGVKRIYYRGFIDYYGVSDISEEYEGLLDWEVSIFDKFFGCKTFYESTIKYIDI